MSEVLEPLRHHSYVAEDDDQLAREANAHLAKLPPLQLVSELLTELRRCEPPWWTPSLLRNAWPVATRMGWLRQRPDLRQRITTGLTGLPPRAARKKSPVFQAELVDAVVDEGDVDVRTFEHAFEPADTAVYGPAEDFWHAFRAQLPIDRDDVDQERFTAWLLRALLSSKGPNGMKRVPILTPLLVRTAIEGRVWHTRMPLEIRVAIDDARFRQERQRPGKAFCARHDLAIALPEHIAGNIPLGDLTEVLNRAEQAMGFVSQQQQELLPTFSNTPSAAAPVASFAPSRGASLSPRAGAASTTDPSALRDEVPAEEPAADSGTAMNADDPEGTDRANANDWDERVA